MESSVVSKAEIFEEIARDRFSCRAFRSEAISIDKVQRLLELAQRAPSDCNTQPWKIYLVEGAKLEQLRAGLVRRQH